MPVDFSKVIGSASYNPNPTTEDKVRKYLTQVPNASASMAKSTNKQQSNVAVQPPQNTTQKNISASATSQKSKSSTITTSNWRESAQKSLENRANQSKVSQSIAESAKTYLGTPYVWGGESMAEGGMDCSGFVYNALNDAGYKVGRTTAQGYRAHGKVVKKSEMQPGDLIFYGTNKNDASHIGIYIGNGQMIHSAGGSSNTRNNPGKGVSIVSVDHRGDFIEARRY